MPLPIPARSGIRPAMPANSDESANGNSFDPERDHDLDWPWTLYFNGEPMPRWANCWTLCNLFQPAKELIGESPWLADCTDFCRLLDRMDLAHTVSSEEPDVFRICCLTMLVLLLQHEPTVLKTLESEAAACGTPPKIIFDGVRDGLAAMHRLTVRDGSAFWSVGYDSDLCALNEAIRRFRFPSSHADRLDPPHVRERSYEATNRIHALRFSLIEVLGTHHQPKDVRRFIHELPTNA